MADTGNTTAPSSEDHLLAAPAARGVVPALVLVWSAHEPDRVAEVSLLTDPPGVACILGREDEADDDRTRRVRFARRRPGFVGVARALVGAKLSRKQLRLKVVGDALDIENIGMLPVSVDGRAVTERAPLRVPPGTVIALHKHSLLLYTLRPTDLPQAPETSAPHPFGGADADGIIGESPAAWDLRANIAAIAPSRENVFIHGETGTGKALVAIALHRQSERPGAFIAHNVANLVDTLLESILFGNAKNYPNPGTPARPGAFGEARRGTLFLDEFGEASIATQARVLRALEGNYVRLGDPRPQESDVRVLAATNREYARIKPDALKRFKLIIETPPLSARREDIPLIARAYLLEKYRQAPKSGAARFVREDDHGSLHVELPQALVLQMMQAPLDGNVRDVQSMVDREIALPPGPSLAPPAPSLAPPPPSLPPPACASPEESAEIDSLLGGLRPGRRQIVAALEETRWHRRHAAENLGISRDALKRLMKTYDIK